MTKQVRQAITPTHVLGSTGTDTADDLGYRALADLKSDLSLDNVDNTSDATKNSATATLTNKTIDDSTLDAYSETGATLSVVDDGDSTYSVTIPLDGKIYQVTLTQDVDLLTTSAPTAPLCGSAVIYITQDATAKTVSVPAGWYWPDGTAEAFDTNSALYRLTLYTDPAGNIHADAELRATA